MSHQEMARLVEHLDKMWEAYTTDGAGNPNGCEWLPISLLANMMSQELGYEDQAEFEDALKGPLSEFLHKLPYVVQKTDNETVYIQIEPEPPQEQWQAVKMTVTINSTKDLWRVCLKSPHARIEVPELEFEIYPDGKRDVDSIYSQITAAVYNLESYVRQSSAGLSDSHRDKILETVNGLNALLDVPKPYTWVLHDPSGMSTFDPMDGVKVAYPQQIQQDQQ